MDTIITTRAQPFTVFPRATHKFAVSDIDGGVRVYDTVAGYYTLCHSLSEREIKRIKSLAGVEHD